MSHSVKSCYTNVTLHYTIPRCLHQQSAEVLVVSVGNDLRLGMGCKITSELAQNVFRPLLGA
jgi:hypothetical protein